MNIFICIMACLFLFFLVLIERSLASIARAIRVDKFPPKVIVVMRNDFPIGVSFSDNGARTIEIEDKKRFGNDSAHHYHNHEFTVKEL